MSSDPAADLMQRLSLLSVDLNRIVLIIQLILGTFGNIMNMLIFTRRNLRTNPCSLYFMASSVNNFVVLYVPVLTRLLASGWKIDPSNYNAVLCKLRLFVFYTSMALIQWFVVLASIDRYLSSCQSATRRQLSSVSMAKKAIGLITIIMLIIHFHTLVWFTVDSIGGNLYCNIFSFEYEIAFQAFFLSTTCIIPPILMTVFGVLTVFNVQKLRSHVTPQNNDGRNDRLRSKDRQLIVMLLIQVSVTLFCTLPFSMGNVALIFTTYVTTISDYDFAIFNFFLNTSRIVLYFNPVVGFYIYTLSGRTFRAEMKAMYIEALKLLLPKIGLERYVPTARQDQGRSMTQEQTATTKGSKKILHRGKVEDVSQLNNK